MEQDKGLLALIRKREIEEEGGVLKVASFCQWLNLNDSLAYTTYINGTPGQIDCSCLLFHPSHFRFQDYLFQLYMLASTQPPRPYSDGIY